MIYRLFRKSLAPTLEILSGAGSGIQLEPRAFFSEILGGTDNGSWEQFSTEYARLKLDLEKRYAEAALNYPVNWRMELASAVATFALVRATKPKVVVETGVANGDSSYFILNALKLNGAGRLISIDVSPDVGALVPEHLKPIWQLCILKRPIATDLKRQIAQIPSVDIFLHDSCHDYRWQSLEYDAVFGKISPGGLLLSDDIDWSYAFVDFVGRRGVRPFALFDGRKVFGAVRKGA